MDSLWQRNPTPKQLRQFGLTVGAALLVMGTILYWRHPGRHIHPYLWWVGGSLVLTGALLPRVLRLPYQLWMAAAYTIGLASTTVILSVTFFLAFTPVAVLLRLRGRDTLDLRWARGSARSYWREREELPVQRRYLRQF